MYAFYQDAGVAGFGGGNRIILKKGIGATYPLSIGINTGNTIWHSTDTGGNHNFYVGSSSILTIASGTSAASPAHSRLMRVARAPAAAARSILRQVAAGP